MDAEECKDDKIKGLIAEIIRLQRIIDSRPAINSALPESYIEWSQRVYQMELLHIAEVSH